VFDYLAYTLCYTHNGDASTQEGVGYLTMLSVSDYLIIGLPDYRTTGLSDYRIIGLPDYRITGLSDYLIIGLPDYRITWLSGRRINGLPDYRITWLSDYRIIGLPDYRIIGSNAEWYDSWMTSGKGFEKCLP